MQILFLVPDVKLLLGICYYLNIPSALSPLLRDTWTSLRACTERTGFMT